jgi:hypothetical protein
MDTRKEPNDDIEKMMERVVDTLDETLNPEVDGHLGTTGYAYVLMVAPVGDPETDGLVRVVSSMSPEDANRLMRACIMDSEPDPTVN